MVELGPTEAARGGQISPFEVRPPERGSRESGTGEARATQVGVVQFGAAQVAAGQAGAPQAAASTLRLGYASVWGNRHLRRGTVIATIEADGTYAKRSGSHAAIYLYQDEAGIRVYDQWQARPVRKRLIRFEGGKGSGRASKSNHGKRFAVIG